VRVGENAITVYHVGCGVVSLVIDIIFATLDARMTTHNTTKISEATHTHTFRSTIYMYHTLLTQYLSTIFYMLSAPPNHIALNTQLNYV
jgi:hypothetical protein